MGAGTLTLDAADALRRYRAALAAGRLVQHRWQANDDGPPGACALGVLTDTLDSTAACPPSVMPAWLAQLLPCLFDGLPVAQAPGWGEAIYTELARLDGKVPFGVLHDWWSDALLPLALGTSGRRDGKAAPHLALIALHRRALAGERLAAPVWRQALRPALAETFWFAYDHARAFESAYSRCLAFAQSRGDPAPHQLARDYAEENTRANAHIYADANAEAYADAQARAFADASPADYAASHAYGQLRAYVDAHALAVPDDEALRREAVIRLADGLLHSLRRAGR